MCGIVGILGREPVAGGLVDALKRLEYRGYDSAGIATLEAGHLTRRRAEGKLKNLEKRLSEEPLIGKIGSPSSTTASSRITASCAKSSAARARNSRPRPTAR